EEVDADGERHDAGRPAELVVQRHHQRTRCGPEAGGAHERDERRDGDKPRGMDASAGHVLAFLRKVDTATILVLTFLKQVRCLTWRCGPTGPKSCVPCAGVSTCSAIPGSC